MDIWQIFGYGLAIVAVLLIQALVRRQRAARGGDAQPGPTREAWRPRPEDVQLRALREVQESAWLQPERLPAPSGPGSAAVAAVIPERAPPPPPPGPVEESTTVVLRKQVPPRDETPRSWIGGLPRMPQSVEWPRGINPDRPDDGPVPLHFICQIALADLPSHLWRGLGPREGWLLLFVNNNTCEYESREIYRFLHVHEADEERAPPADLRVVHDGSYTDRTDWVMRERTYPRVPVDIVSMPNRFYERDGMLHASPANLDALLYEGQTIGENRPWRVLSQPFTWRCVALAAEQALAAMNNPRARADTARFRERTREKLLEPGAFAAILADKQAYHDKLFAGPRTAELLAADPATLDATALERRAFAEAMRHEVAASRALLDRYTDAAALLAFLAEQNEPAWEERAQERLAALLEHARAKGSDAPIGEAEWHGLRETLAQDDRVIWSLGWAPGSGSAVTVSQRKLSVLERLEARMTSACADEVKRCYLDPRLRGLIPTDALPAFEAHLRSLHDNRPCRLGGYHDGVQSDVGPHPDGKLLLLQMACDYTLEMLWGDCGAVYAYITPQDLEAGRFDKAEFQLECH